MKGDDLQVVWHGPVLPAALTELLALVLPPATVCKTLSQEELKVQFGRPN